MVDYRRIETKPIAGALGAEIHGVDLSQSLDHETVAEVRQALLRHLVVFFRDQDLSSAQYLAFARTLGTPIEYPYVSGLEGFPEIHPVMKLEHEEVNFGGLWHSDTAYLAEPPMATMLYAREVPPVGGDTLFANMYLAYETLSDGMKRLLDGLSGVNTSEKAIRFRPHVNRKPIAGSNVDDGHMTAVHPIARTHPETGRKTLYANIAHTVEIQGMTEAESAPILDYLFAHQVRPEFTCRFRWQPGSIALWDNRATQHNAINDYPGRRRVMHRITMAADPAD